MRRYSKLHLLLRYSLIFTAGMVWQAAAWGFQPFTVHAIRAEGLQRLDLGTVLTYLPLTVGDQINDDTTAKALRSLYASGLFQNVELLRQGSTLVVKVKERPQIAEFSIKGNEKVGGEKLKESMKDVGLAKGELFKRDLLDQLTQELRQQYYANGYYAVNINTKVTQLPNNRVDIHVKVGEGDPATIKAINIVGNAAFSQDTLLDQIKLKTPQWWNLFQSSDHYSREQLGGDLEALSSYYQDRGYLKFNIASVQVALTPDKKDVYITINVDEGKLFKVKGYRFSGDTILNKEFLGQLVSTHAGDTFSRKRATDSSDRIEAALADIGYAFAKVTPSPVIDDNGDLVSIEYQINPGKRVYVRHISFSGYGDTNDSTLRREMRQLEAAPFSKSAVERSRVRLARLPFIEDVKVNTVPVPGTNDQVDINYTVKERQPGSIQLGVGYSGYQGFLISAGITHTNFLGTGDTVSLNVANSQVERSVALSWTNPYFTEDGISQTVALTYRRDKGVIRFNSGFDTNTIGADLVYGIPLSEFTTLRLGGGVSRTAITTFPAYSANEVLKFVLDNGSVFNEYTFKTGISHDTRNRTFFATRGMLDQLNLDVQAPFSDLDYYTVNFLHTQYFSLPYRFFIQFNSNIGYINTYGGTKGVPPYENFFAGGPGTVRGFKSGYLGPKDSNGYPYGGTLLTTAETLLVVPLPVVSNNTTTRSGVFFDVGNVFAKPQDFRFNQLRQSVGVAFQWFTPIVGLLKLSVAYPVKRVPGDNTEYFQITFGNSF